MTVKSVFTSVVFVGLCLYSNQVFGEDLSHQRDKDSIIGTKIVDYRDLDLSSDDGQRQLNSRVSNAVLQLCEANTVSTIPLYELLGQKRCRKAAIRYAEPQIAAAISKAQSAIRLATTSEPKFLRLTAK